MGDQDAYGLLNATVAYTTQSGKWRFALNGSNLTDEEYLQAGYDFGCNKLHQPVGLLRCTQNLERQRDLHVLIGFTC